VHPPGGATSLIFLLQPAAQETGWLYVLFPSCFAACVMVAVAFFFNRAVGRTYPQYWW
jgi:CBS-domain-containing membrane protein